MSTHYNKKYYFQAGDIFLTILFFISIGLTIWAINIYRLTIIEIKFLFASVMFGIITAFTVLSWLIKSNYSTIWALFIKAGIGGGFFYFGLLFFNLYFADKESETEQFKIVKKGTLVRRKGHGCSQPYVDIDFYGTQKKIDILLRLC